MATSSSEQQLPTKVIDCHQRIEYKIKRQLCRVYIFKSTYCLKSYLPSTIQLWNILPLHITSLPSVSSFSNVLKTLYYKNPAKILIRKSHGKYYP